VRCEIISWIPGGNQHRYPAGGKTGSLYWDVSVVLRVKTIRVPRAEVIGNESVPKIIINDTIKLFLNCNQHFGNST